MGNPPSWQKLNSFGAHLNSLLQWILGQYAEVPRSRSINIHKKREKNPGEKSWEFVTRIFLLFWVNTCFMLCRAQHIAIISYFLVAKTTPSPPLGVNTDKYAPLLLVLWRQKTCNNVPQFCPPEIGFIANLTASPVDLFVKEILWHLYLMAIYSVCTVQPLFETLLV